VEWIDSLRDTIVGLDTAPFIYFIEEHPVWLPRIQPFFHALDRGLFRAVTSTVTLTEVLVHPFRRSQGVLVEQYRQILLSARNLTTMPVTAVIAEQAAELRARHNLRTPDAIQLATAIHAKAGSFLTNDKEISLPVPLRIITLEGLRTAVT
jgi:predicted nucleic acid-binding protein